MCQRMGSRLVWAISNFVVFACMAGTAIISLISVRGFEDELGANGAIKTAALVIFVILGFPLAVRIFLFFFIFIFLVGMNYNVLNFCHQKSTQSCFIICIMQITYSVPFSVTAELTADSGGGQGLNDFYSLSILFFL